jgi:hypothetical protein
VFRVEVGLVIEQQLVHLPELSLSPGTFRGFGGLACVRMDFFEGVMSKGEAHVTREAIEQDLHSRRSLLAVWTLEIAVLDDDDRSVVGPENVIHRADGLYEIRVQRAIHR